MKKLEKISILSFIASILLFNTSMITNQPERTMVKHQKDIKNSIIPDIGIKPTDLALSADILNKILAGEFVLLHQTLNYHWNLVGPEFHDYHLLFDEQYKEIFKRIDEIAERVRAIGGIALGTMADMIQQSPLTEQIGDIPAPRTMVENLLSQHESLTKEIRDGITKTGENNRDMGTNNFLAGLIEKHELTAWMLRSLLERR